MAVQCGVMQTTNSSMTRSLILLSLALLALLASCFPTEACGCPPALGVGTVAGVVQRAEGSPAPGALVRVDVSLRGCLWTESHLVDPNVVTAGPDGQYHSLLRAYAPSDTACLRVTAVDTAQGHRDSVSVAGIRMRLISSYGTRERPDSIRLDLLLP
jgi:hypothetical protein